jgi:hypothetical protein
MPVPSIDDSSTPSLAIAPQQGYRRSPPCMADQACGLHIWYDANEVRPGGRIVSELAKAIPDCRSLILVAPAAVRSGYVQDEYTAAMNERNDTGGSSASSRPARRR